MKDYNNSLKLMAFLVVLMGVFVGVVALLISESKIKELSVLLVFMLLIWLVLYKLFESL